MQPERVAMAEKEKARCMKQHLTWATGIVGAIGAVVGAAVLYCGNAASGKADVGDVKDLEVRMRWVASS